MRRPASTSSGDTRVPNPRVAQKHADWLRGSLSSAKRRSRLTSAPPSTSACTASRCPRPAAHIKGVYKFPSIGMKSGSAPALSNARMTVAFPLPAARHTKPESCSFEAVKEPSNRSITGTDPIAAARAKAAGPAAEGEAPALINSSTSSRFPVPAAAANGRFPDASGRFGDMPASRNAWTPRRSWAAIARNNDAESYAYPNFCTCFGTASG